MSDEKLLSKTLTFGVGFPYAFNVRKGTIEPLQDDVRKAVYEHMRRASCAVAQACNIETAKRYVQVTLGIDKSQEEIKPSNPALRKRVADCDWIAGGTLSQSYKLTDPHFAGDHGKELITVGSRQLPTHRTDGSHPIPFRHDGTRLFLHEKAYWLCVQLLEVKYAKTNNLPNWLAFPIIAKKRDKTLNGQLQRLTTGEWMLRNSRLARNMRRKGPRWNGQVVLQYKPEPYKTLNPGVVMGIDLGVNAPAAIHIRPQGSEAGEHWAMIVGNGRQLLASRNVIRSEIRTIVRGLRAKDSGLIGGARAQAQERLRDLRKKEKAIIKTGSQRIAKQIAEAARRNGAGTWQLEDLKLKGGLKEDSWLARNWAPGTLIDAIRWNAQKLGVSLVLVNPAYTSQRCAKCGHISRANRPKASKGQEHFQCVACGRKENADKNAARNLSITGIQDLIAATVPPKEESNGSE
ncbi:MAG: transposase [Sumerlaeia bacterium]